MVIWASLTEVSGYRPFGTGSNAILTVEDGIRLVFTAFGRLQVTTVIFSDAVLRMAVAHWRLEKTRTENKDDQAYAEIAEEFLAKSGLDLNDTNARFEEKESNNSDEHKIPQEFIGPRSGEYEL